MTLKSCRMVPPCLTLSLRDFVWALHLNPSDLSQKKYHDDRRKKSRSIKTGSCLRGTEICLCMDAFLAACFNFSLLNCELHDLWYLALLYSSVSATSLPLSCILIPVSQYISPKCKMLLGNESFAEFKFLFMALAGSCRDSSCVHLTQKTEIPVYWSIWRFTLGTSPRLYDATFPWHGRNEKNHHQSIRSTINIMIVHFIRACYLLKPPPYYINI